MIAALVLAALMTPAATSAATAAIVNSGSTNTASFGIVISTDGTAVEMTSGARPVRRKLSPAAARAFFSDLGAARPLNRLAVVRCMKSASFGTTTRILWRSQATPDLSCPSTNAVVLRLSRDIAVIEAQFWGTRLRTQPIAIRRISPAR
ncbi:MAG TPA: hypothetical protein VGD50_04670 [Candidatus Baltobacteraceae bacterium]